jgi:protein required for attachment to host cells
MGREAQPCGDNARSPTEINKKRDRSMRVPHNTLVAVADGRKLLFLRNEGDATIPVLRTVKVDVKPNPKDSDQKTDLAGSARGGGTVGTGGSGSSMNEPDDHQLEEDRFAAEAADLLKTRASNGDFETLIVVAPPRTLGEMRKHYHKEVSSRLAGELAKDLTNHPVDEIEKILSAAE